MAHEKAGATIVFSGMAGFLVWCFWPKPCANCTPLVKCPTGDYPSVGGVCPDGYAPDPSATGCCMPTTALLASCPTCPAPQV